MMEFLKTAAIMAVIALALWGAYSLGRADGHAAGILEGQDRRHGEETPLQSLALKLAVTNWPHLRETKRFRDLDADNQERWLRTAKACKASCACDDETEGGAA